MNQKDKQKPSVLLMAILHVICCGAIILLALGGAGLLSGLITGQWFLIVIGLFVVILGVYFYFRRRE